MAGTASHRRWTLTLWVLLLVVIQAAWYLAEPAKSRGPWTWWSLLSLVAVVGALLLLSRWISRRPLTPEVDEALRKALENQSTCKMCGSPRRHGLFCERCGASASLRVTWFVAMTLALTVAAFFWLALTYARTRRVEGKRAIASKGTGMLAPARALAGWGETANYPRCALDRDTSRTVLTPARRTAYRAYALGVSRKAQGPKTLSVAALAILLNGCPYDAQIQPEGESLPLRSSLVGTWVCDASNDPDWADLSVGWTDGPAYILTLRPRRPDRTDELPWVFRGTPRRVSGSEVWTLPSDQPEDENAPQYMFARVTYPSARSVRWAILGGNEGGPGGHLDVTSSSDLSRLLADPSKAVEDTVIECHR
jgi:hypothetical protein